MASNNPLSETYMRQYAPSIFAETAHISRSSRYAHIPTVEVLRGLAKEGFLPFAVNQSRTRTPDKRDHTKHMVRLRHADTLAKAAVVGADVNEIVLVNSHDGSSAYQMMAGVFRFICSNGLVVGNFSQDIRIRHSGDVVSEVTQAAYRVLSGFSQVDASKHTLKSLQLTSGQQTAYATAALAIRYPEVVTTADYPITPSQVLTTRRSEDRDASLWTTFQRAQENLVQGGRRSPTTRRRTRAVTGIDGNIALNRALWVLTEEMAKLIA